MYFQLPLVTYRVQVEKTLYLQPDFEILLDKKQHTKKDRREFFARLELSKYHRIRDLMHSWLRISILLRQAFEFFGN